MMRQNELLLLLAFCHRSAVGSDSALAASSRPHGALLPLLRALCLVCIHQDSCVIWSAEVVHDAVRFALLGQRADRFDVVVQCHLGGVSPHVPKELDGPKCCGTWDGWYVGCSFHLFLDYRTDVIRVLRPALF